MLNSIPEILKPSFPAAAHMLINQSIIYIASVRASEGCDVTVNASKQISHSVSGVPVTYDCCRLLAVVLITSSQCKLNS